MNQIIQFLSLGEILMPKLDQVILNSNGNHLLELANRNNLVLTNTTFKHKLAHRATWVSSCNYKNRRNPVRNQIDYMLVRISHLKCVLDSRSYSGLFLDTDHRMVITKIKITDKRNNFRKLRVERNNLNSINIDNLGNQTIRREYCNKVEEKLKEEKKIDQKDLEPQEQWKVITNVILTTATEILGKKSTKNQKK